MPTTTAPAGTSRVTTAFAPTTAPSPITTPGRIITPRPIQALRPITIGAAVEKGGSADQRVQVNSSRLVVVSNATFVQDNAITQDQQGLDFISGSVNWLLSREQLIGIAPKVPKPLTFSLNEEALRQLRWILLVFIPLVPALIGTMVWWQRRV